ncbi:hypothetical protein OsI_13890 [Oryza sativa Indica Group]|uniref:F-box domain-containing protein n=2 Tax=Oryza TaxID=4527 RepID=A2XMW5_ORYSI|nr:hypothetical protein OsI_13890 [Oryza sativa Indica Group]
MARTRSNKDRRRRRACGEDRLSALPDDLLHLILRRLDTRDALATAALSRRWAAVPRELPRPRFPSHRPAAAALPPVPCHRRQGQEVGHRARGECARLDAATGRYERRAMRAMAGSVRALLAARRRATRLSLEVFDFDASPCINQLVVTAVDSWGVTDLEVSAVPTGPIMHPPPVYSFPLRRISRDPGASRLRRLKLRNCLPPPLQGFGSLATLVLQGLPCSTRPAVYQGVVAACPQLQSLHLSSCMSRKFGCPLTLDAPMSRIRELVVDGGYMAVEIRSLPMLESLASNGDAVFLTHPDAAPYLQRVSLEHAIGSLQGDELFPAIERRRLRFLIPSIREFLQNANGITDLVLRFTGPYMWILFLPTSPFAPMPKLRRLLVADVPPSWDASWPRLLVEAAPLLETLHVHHHSEEEELVVMGFRSAERRHVQLVRFAMEASTSALRRVALYKRGHVEHKGPGAWEAAAARDDAWSDEERRGVLEQITEGMCCSTGQVQVILG